MDEFPKCDYRAQLFSSLFLLSAYVGMFNLLSYISYYFSVVLMFKRVYFLPGGKNSRVK